MRPKSKLITKIFASLVVIILLVGIAGCFFAIYVADEILKTKPELNVSLFEAGDSSTIYDTNDNKIEELGLYLRESITYDDMSDSIIDAFVAIEDSRYFEHPGFDVPRFAKAFIENIKAGEFAQGGSTFTMQLVKNTYFQVDDGEQSTIAPKSIERKVKEIVLALELNSELSKKEIFELYLNKLNFGKNIRGIEKASQYYFGKSASDVNLSEAALLAGIINLPNRYNPYEYLDYATNRRNTVLDMMKYHGYINDEELQLAKSIKVEDLLVGEDLIYTEQDGANRSYIDAVISEAYQLTGYDPALYPMQIYTYMDTDIQDTINAIQDGSISNIQFSNDLMQIAMVVLDNQTGAIIGLGGGRNYEGERVFNRAVDMYMQPGSAIKPVFNYALAFEDLGWATSHVITDQPIVYRGTNIPIYNFNRRYYGDVRLPFATGISLNTPVIQSIQELADKKGVDYLVNYLQDIGFSKVKKEQFDLGYAIGGSSFVVSPVELAAAHGMLMNEGEYIPPHTIKKIVMPNGETITHDYVAKQVLSAEAAYLVSTLTKDAVETSYNNYMQILDSPYSVYGKTGTSDWGTEAKLFNIPEGAPKDRWMVASTTEYTSLIWEGFDKGVKDGNTWLTDADAKYNIRGKALRLILDTLYDDSSSYPSSVKRPAGISDITHIEGTWPYAAPSDIGNVVTGQIKSEFNKLSSLYEGKQSTSLNGISAQRFEDGAYVVNFSGFAFQDENGNWLRDMSLTLPDKTIHATGTVLFDYSWVYGNPTFVARVYNNNEIVNEVVGDSASLSGWLDPSIQGNLKVCGYFYYGNGNSSNERCTSMN